MNKLRAQGRTLLSSGKTSVLGRRLLVRVDASQLIGTGHAMRCLALAQAWKDRGGSAMFVMNSSTRTLLHRLRSEAIGLSRLDTVTGSEEDALLTASLAEKISADWLAIDGYGFRRAYQRVLGRHGLRTLLLDDFAQIGSYDSDVILDQNVDVDRRLYSRRRPDSQLLVGTRFALLRREFLKSPPRRDGFSERARRILVTMGGVDRPNVTSKALRALNRLTDDRLAVTVLAGSENTHLPGLRAMVKKSPHRVRLILHAPEVCRIMRATDLAISSASTTSTELAFMRVPSVLISIADNQRSIAEAMGNSGAAVDIGWHSTVTTVRLGEVIHGLIRSRSARKAIAKVAGNLFDGEGPERVIRAMVRGRVSPPKKS